MPRDLRWTGGTANRAWQRGSQPLGRVIDTARLEAQVRRYLADCRQHRALLSPQYHPTADSACKAIFHRSREEEAVIRTEFRRQVSGSKLEAVSAGG